MESREKLEMVALSVLVIDLDEIELDDMLVCQSVVEAARGLQDAVWGRLRELGEEAASR